MRILMTLQYLGTRYAGWQTQANAVGVQQVINEALSRMFGTPLQVEGAGRTDAGVHARAQRAHADVPFAIPSRGFVLGMNNLLPADIRVTAVEEVTETFHARFDAHGKSYVYRIWNDAVTNVFASATHAHVAQPLDVAAMTEAASALLGEHDFRAFTMAAPEVSTTVRTLATAEVTRAASAIVLTFSGDGFLRYMVRRMAGCLIEVGRGKLTAAGIAVMLEPTFAAARWTAPAHGLTLWDVRYDGLGSAS